MAGEGVAGGPGGGGSFLGRGANSHCLDPSAAIMLRSASDITVPVHPAPTGPRAGDYTYREGLEHKCKRDILLGRLRSSEDQTWKRIRPRPTKTSFVGSYYLCKGGCAAAGAAHPARASLFCPAATLLLITGRQIEQVWAIEDEFPHQNEHLLPRPAP